MLNLQVAFDNTPRITAHDNQTLQCFRISFITLFITLNPLELESRSITEPSCQMDAERLSVSSPTSTALPPDTSRARERDRERRHRERKQNIWYGLVRTKKVHDSTESRDQKSRNATQELTTSSKTHERDERRARRRGKKKERSSSTRDLSPSDSDSATSSTDDSADEISLEVLLSGLRDLSKELPREKRSIPERIAYGIKMQERSRRTLLASITKMHKADSYKRDDTHFGERVKVLRHMIENWSKTQRKVSSNMKLWSSDTLLETFALYSSTETKTFGHIALQYFQHTARTEDDLARILQTYIWTVLMKCVFGKYQWSGNVDAYTALATAIAPSKSKLHLKWNCNL